MGSCAGKPLKPCKHFGGIGGKLQSARLRSASVPSGRDEVHTHWNDNFKCNNKVVKQVRQHLSLSALFTLLSLT